MIKNKKIQKAEEELNYLTGDAATRRIAELREKGIRDERAALNRAKKEGINESKIAVAKKMLENNETIEIIMKYTGLTEKEIQKLK